MTAWQDKTWGDLATLEYGKSLAGYDESTGQYRVFGTNGPIGRCEKPLTPSATVIIGRKGAYRGVHYSPEPCFVIDTAFYLKPKTNLDIRWAYYQLLTQDINGMDSGSAIPSTSRSDFYYLPVTVPPPAEQQAIGGVLGALDDKIEVNRRMNETLEALGQTEFGRMKDDGGESGILGDLVDLHTDRVDATPAKNGERYIALEDMPPKSIDLSNYQPGSAVNSSIISFRRGDILFGSMRPYFHKVGLAFFDGITRTTTFVLRPKQARYRHLALFQFFSTEVVEYATTASVGTTIPYVKWDALQKYKITIPSDTVLDAFEISVMPLVQRIAANGEESRPLAALRDALLPKLLSGAVRVRRGEVDGMDAGRTNNA